MSLIVWNFCGLKNLCIGKEFEAVIRAKDPSAMFIVKTWADKAKLKEIQRQIEFENLFFVERNKKVGV